MRRKAMRPIAMAVGVLMIAAAPSWAEQTGSKTDATRSTSQAGHILAPARAKPEQAKRSVGTGQQARTQAQPWSIKEALPENSKALAVDPEPKTKPAIGRVPWRSGSVGFETESKIKSTEYPDGQKVPGYETTARHPPSYLGFSLSVPTSGKSMWPLFSDPQ